MSYSDSETSNLPDDISSGEALQLMLPDPTHLHSKGRTAPFIVFQYILGIALQITEEAHCPEHPKCQ
jgi:hypothetical protein